MNPDRRLVFGCLRQSVSAQINLYAWTEDIDGSERREGWICSLSAQHFADAERAVGRDAPICRKWSRPLKAEPAIDQANERISTSTRYGTQGAVRDVLDDDGQRIAAPWIAGIAEELVTGHLRIQVAEVHVDHPVVTRAQNAFEFEAPDVGIDRIVDGRPSDNAAELQVLVFIIEAREIDLRRSIEEGVLRADFESVDLFRAETF